RVLFRSPSSDTRPLPRNRPSLHDHRFETRISPNAESPRHLSRHPHTSAYDGSDERAGLESNGQCTDRYHGYRYGLRSKHAERSIWHHHVPNQKLEPSVDG